MVTFWAFQTKGSQYWDSFYTSGFLALNRTTGHPSPLENDYYLVDQTNAQARAASFDAFWAGYGRYGIRSVWLDATEPEREAYSFGDFQLAAGTDSEVGRVYLVWPSLMTTG